VGIEEKKQAAPLTLNSLASNSLEDEVSLWSLSRKILRAVSLPFKLPPCRLCRVVLLLLQCLQQVQQLMLILLLCVVTDALFVGVVVVRGEEVEFACT